MSSRIRPCMITTEARPRLKSSLLWWKHGRSWCHGAGADAADADDAARVTWHRLRRILPRVAPIVLLRQRGEAVGEHPTLRSTHARVPAEDQRNEQQAERQIGHGVSDITAPTEDENAVVFVRLQVLVCVMVTSRFTSEQMNGCCRVTLARALRHGARDAICWIKTISVLYCVFVQYNHTSDV